MEPAGLHVVGDFLTVWATVSLSTNTLRYKHTSWTVRGSNAGEGEIFDTHSDRPVVKRLGREVKNKWIYTSAPPICLQGVDLYL
jgi:hypothetical protein